MRLKSTFKFLFFMLVSLPVNLFCQQYKTADNISDIFIKNGFVIKGVNIQNVEKWGLIINDSNKYISYKVVDRILTNNSGIVCQLSNFVDSLIIDTTNTGYVINFVKAKIKYKPAPVINKPLPNSSFYAALTNSKYENIELGAIVFFNFMPDNVYIKFTSTFNTANHYEGYYINGIFAGLGFAFNYKFISLLCGVNYGEKTVISPPPAKDEFKQLNIFAPEILAKVNFLNNHLFITGGARYYSDNAKINGNIKHLGTFIGFGLNL